MREEASSIGKFNVELLNLNLNLGAQVKFSSIYRRLNLNFTLERMGIEPLFSCPGFLRS